MTVAPMQLSVTQVQTDAGTRRSIHLNNLYDKDRQAVEIYFDMLEERDLPFPSVLDGFVIGIIFYAMRLGQDIHVQGSVSHEFLRNVNEFQDAWAVWKKGILKRVSILPDHIVDDVEISRHEAIAAFSGGVDATFTALRHAKKALGLASYPLKKSVLMVHGFDVPLNAPEQFEALKDRMQPLMDELGLTIRTIRTNLKELNLQDWEDSFLSQLACCLHNYSHEFDAALVGSSEPYNGLVLPWGSNPVTDHLLSGAFLKIVHDGAAYSRTEKVELISKNATASRVVKVCWEGSDTFKNCGICEKCLRTRLNFLAAGADNPPCFDGVMDIGLIKTITPKNNAQCAELISIVEYMKERNIQKFWISDLQKVINKFKTPSLHQKMQPKLYKLMSKVKTLAGLIKKGEWKTIVEKIFHKLHVSS